jgi:hypothetical protein
LARPFFGYAVGPICSSGSHKAAGKKPGCLHKVGGYQQADVDFVFLALKTGHKPRFGQLKGPLNLAAQLICGNLCNLWRK